MRHILPGILVALWGRAAGSNGATARCDTATRLTAETNTTPRYIISILSDPWWHKSVGIPYHISRALNSDQ